MVEDYQVERGQQGEARTSYRCFELKKLRDGARLSTLQSTAPYLKEHASIYLQSTSLYTTEHVSVYHGALLCNIRSNAPYKQEQ